jgi:hypothetical protein
MENIKSKSICLASLAVFRELYNSEKDVYGIIAAFLKEIIISNSKYQFTLAEITRILNSTFDFKIPEAVVKSSLNRLKFLKKSEGYYYTNNLAGIESTDINKKQLEIQQNNDILIENLFKFIEEEKKEKLTNNVKEKIVYSFCSFILDSSDGLDYAEYISAFVIKNKKNVNFTNKLNIIKEGVVLYSGIKYNSNLNALGSWNTKLTIFIDTEVLFHFAGYNGELYKTLFNDFLSLVKEINSKGKGKLIKLKYFPEVKNEIDSYFKKAEYIVKGQDKANPSATAMNSIINGCKMPGDIIEKKTKFYELLKTSGISEDNYTNYFSPSNHKYNIVDLDIINKISETIGIEDITDYLRFLNFISIHRKEANSNNFDNIGYILLSGNYITLKVAWHEEIKKQGNVPLATDLNFLTNKFWFKLNKGFGSNSYPKTFDIITKAQIVLSTQINKTVAIQYDELQTKFQKGELTEEQAVATIINLRKQARKPEDIEEDNVKNILDSISEESVEKYLQEQEYFKNKAKENEEENEKLKECISIKELQLQEKEKKEIESINKTIEAKGELLREKKRNLKNLEKQKESIDKQAISKFNKYKIFFVIGLFVYYGGLVFLSITLGWDIMEPWTYISSLIPVAASLFYILLKEKSLNPSILLKNIKDDVFNKKYLIFNFDVNKIQTLKDEIVSLEKEIEELKKASTQ